MKISFKTKVEGRGDSVLIFLTTKNFFSKSKCEKPGEGLNFKAEYNEKIILAREGNLSVIVGLGEDIKLNNTKLEKFGYELLNYIESNKFSNVTLLYNVEPDCKNVNDNDKNLLSILKGIMLGDYKFNKYFSEEKQEEKKIKLENLTLIIKSEKKFKAEYEEFLTIRDNVFFCRDLVNEPSNVINPDTYSEICKQLTKYGLDVEILGEKQMLKLGMNSLLAVGQGSAFESKLVVLKWKGLDKFEDPIAFVGKGVTFDSGGISIKPSKGMGEMKCDMAGSAVVVSLMKLLAQRKAKVNAIGVVAMVENMPSGTAIKPCDIVKSMSGQTIEIINTDAEGRLILADELYYAASKFKPQTIIDLATLTGAIMVALGSFRAGVFSNSESLTKEIESAAKDTGEAVWRMPLGEIGCDYDKIMDSDVADVRNHPNIRDAGSVTAAQFLQRFINKHTKWAHIDIAGTAFVDKSGFFVENGATGYGVRLLNTLIEGVYEKKN
ncbi:MAG: leucyl aminopeptidase [Rickettsiales bacterium]|jgi:leucyl aminopeptidase|nr:leucyl aminopeptidase [Rickettsiales bacterium]